MKSRSILVILSFFICTLASSQVLNVDREIEVDTVFKRARASFNFNFANDKQKKNLIDFSNASELDYFLKKVKPYPKTLSYFQYIINISNFRHKLETRYRFYQKQYEKIFTS